MLKPGKLMAEPRWKPGSSRVWHLAYLTTKLHRTVPEKAESKCEDDDQDNDGIFKSNDSSRSHKC